MTDTELLPTPRLFHVILSVDVLVLTDSMVQAEVLAERQGPRDAVWESETTELRELLASYSPDDVVLASFGNTPTLAECLARGQAPYLKGDHR